MGLVGEDAKPIVLRLVIYYQYDHYSRLVWRTHQTQTYPNKKVLKFEDFFNWTYFSTSYTNQVREEVSERSEIHTKPLLNTPKPILITET